MKKKFILGLLLIMAMAVCGAFLIDVPQHVFATEEEASSTYYVEDEAGKFYGKGYYEVGDLAELRAEMNDGYWFVCWTGYDKEGNEIFSNDSINCSFTVNCAMTITYQWKRNEYNLTFDSLLMNDGELKDFKDTIINKTEPGDKIYYNNQVEVKIEVNTDKYVMDLDTTNIYINNESVYNLIRTGKIKNSDCVITNNQGTTGFDEFVLLLTITEDVEIDIKYTRMHQFKIVSGNEIQIDRIAQFVTVSNHYSFLEGAEHIYLVAEGRKVSLKLSAGDKIYKLVSAIFEGYDNNLLENQSYYINGDRTLTITCEKEQYNISFSSYLKNIYDKNEVLTTPFYTLPIINLTAGDSIDYSYNSTTKAITVAGVEYPFPDDVYGYEFVGFEVGGALSTSATYTIDAVNPESVEIKLMFRYIEYQFDAQLIDTFFESGVTYGYEFNNTVNKLVTGTKIKLNATSTEYIIKGWSLVDNPQTEDDYIDGDEIIFNPTTNDNSGVYIAYLDVDYKYEQARFSLNSRSIEQYARYDQVVVDVSGSITFKNTSVVEDKIKINANIVSNGENKTIELEDTAIFSNVQIIGNKLTYIYDANTITVTLSENNANIYTYTCDKYVYFGDLKASVITHIKISEMSSSVRVDFYGKSSNGVTEFEGVVESFVAEKFEQSENVYLLDYQYPITLHTDNENYDYITMHGVDFYYDSIEGEFRPRQASVSPTPVNIELNKGDTYSLTINNLLPTSIVMYQTKGLDSNYSFVGFSKSSGSGIRGFMNENGDYNTCILNMSITDVKVDYRKLANDVYIVINNEQAYGYELEEGTDGYSYVIVKVNGNIAEGGRSVAAEDGDTVVIEIASDKIMPGYQFDGFNFPTTSDTDENIYTFTFKMRNSYANKRFEINFSAINYKINVYYIDDSEIIINSNQAKGELKLSGDNTILTQIEVNITGEYVFVATAQKGYYVGKARIGTDDMVLGSLLGSNDNENLVTAWTLNYTNFQDAIITSAGNGDEVNLYINFTIHTYNLKVYFEIPENASLVSIYPVLKIDGKSHTVKVVKEGEVDKYVVVEDNFGYMSNISLSLDFKLGTTIDKWIDKSGTAVSDSSSYQLAQIAENTILTVKLQYIEYAVRFILVDEMGREGNYATVPTQSAKWLKSVYYTVNLNPGYVLKDKYYYNSYGVKGDGSIDSGFIFNPSSFKIEGLNVKIYLVFGLKTINLSFENEIEGSKYYFKKHESADLASFTITRLRKDEHPVVLTDETGYQFQTGDTMIMEVTPCSIGLLWSTIRINGDDFASYSSIVTENKLDEVLTSFTYTIQIEFYNVIIEDVDENAILTNILKVRTYEINYTYNYIDYKFGIKLIRADATGSEFMPPKNDQAITMTDVGFGTDWSFSYDYDGISSGDGAKFNVDGFTIDGIKQDAKSKFTLKDISLWEQLARNKYYSDNNKIAVVLVLKPKITLKNYTSDKDGYLYETQYNGEVQGLTTAVENADVVVGGDFEIIIHYSYDNGVSFVDVKPINVGDYPVRIIAKITSTSGKTPQETRVQFEEDVTYRITKAPLTLVLNTYNSTNPIIKTYGELDSDYLHQIIDDIGFNGLCARDLNNINIDKSQATIEFSTRNVNKLENLADITLRNIVLKDNENKEILNYKISSGQSVIFSRIGKIDPKKLTIQGFVVNNKIYDGTDTVVANVEGIRYVGKLPSDSTQILTENLRFYLADYEIGENKEVLIDWSQALTGADRENYEVVYDKTYINIHPKELSYTLQGVGTFKVVDLGVKPLIPIGSKIIVREHERGSSEYKSIYGLVGTDIKRNEKLKACYEVVLQVGSMNLTIPEGLYVYIPKINKVTQVVQVFKEGETQSLEPKGQDNYIVVKVTEGDAKFAVITNTTYLPLWAIILIVVASAVFIGVMVLIFIIVRRRTKNKYKAYDRI